MKYWFTSDYHLGHKNIIKYCDRPFQSVDHMNKEIIRRHNERVKEQDCVIFVGDFCFRTTPGGKGGEGQQLNAVEYIKQLNGNITFVKGNHDKNNSLRTPISSLNIYIKELKDYAKVVHNPIHADEKRKINIVGHVHNNWEVKRLNKVSVMVNVSTDVWKFHPVDISEIMGRYHKFLKNEKI